MIKFISFKYSTMAKPNGCYKNITKKRYGYLKIVDDVVTSHQAGKAKPFDRIKIEYGEFGEVHPKIENITGKKNYNFKLIINWNESNPDDTWERKGLASEDTTRLYFKKDEDPNDIEVYALISKVFTRKVFNFLKKFSNFHGVKKIVFIGRSRCNSS